MFDETYYLSDDAILWKKRFGVAYFFEPNFGGMWLCTGKTFRKDLVEITKQEKDAWLLQKMLMTA